MKKQTTDAAINTRTAWRPILKPVARLLIAAQLALVLQPLSVLAQEGQAPVNPAAQAQLTRLAQWDQKLQQAKTQTAAAAKSPADQVSDKLSQAEELVAKLKRAGTPDKPAKHQQLKALLADIRDGTAHVRSEFAATRAALVAKKLPAEILQRHDEAVAQFEQRAAKFAQIEASQVSGEEKVGQLDQFFRRYPAKKRHTPIDPGKLPWGSPKATPRMPAETKTAWHQIITKDQKVQLAQAGGLTTIGGVQFSIPPEPVQAPQDADLSENVDVQLTPAIRAMAAELGHNPVHIHNWVYNNVQWLPTWGSIQGADGTLKTLRGNAFDTASLTIALLRASGIPARYQFGTIDVPAVQAMNWVGGVQRPEAVLNLMYQGGIAARGIASGGRITTIRIEHVWVNAYVNWAPSRGSRQGGALTNPPVNGPHGQAQHPNPNGNLNAWVPLDASFKQYTYTQGMNLQSAVPIDASALIAAVQQGATVTSNYAQNLNQANMQAQLASYQNQLKTYIDSQMPNASVGDVLGTQVIAQRNPAMLAGVLPNVTVIAGNESAEIPNALRWKVALKLFQTDTDRANDSPSVNVERPLARLNDKRLAISFEPATSADQAVIDSAAQAGQISFAAYLTRYVPKIKLDFEVLGEGYAQQPGLDGTLNVVMKGPAGDIGRDYGLTSGDTSVLGLNIAGVPANKYMDRARDYAMSELDTMRYGPGALTEEMLHQLGLLWWAQKYVGQESLASFSGVVNYALPSHALQLTPISVSFFFGVPRSASFKARVIDAKLDYVMLEHKNGDVARRKQFVRAAGRLGSYMEGAIFDQAFSPFNPNGVSTVSMIGQAHSQGAKIYLLKSGDEALVTQLGISPDVQSEITNALAHGSEVTVPDREVSFGSFSGLGYIIEDPMDGSAAYQIDGGRSGGEAAALPNVIPLPAMPDANYLSLLLGSQLRQANAKLAIDSGGMVVGLVLAANPVAVPIEAVLALMVTLYLLAQNQSKVFERTYPPQLPPNRFRHYTNAQAKIVGSHYLLFSSEGLLGDGVYVADALSEEQRGVTCAALDPLDIVTRFQIPPPPQAPNPNRVTGFVEITESARGWLKYVSGPNPTGQVEYLIRGPVSWVINPNRTEGTPFLVRALLLVPFGPASITGVCPLF